MNDCELKPTNNPILANILKRYVSANSVGYNLDDTKQLCTGASCIESVECTLSYTGRKYCTHQKSSEPVTDGGDDTDWYNMTCPRCPWFVDGVKTGVKTGEYTVVNNDMASKSSNAPDNAPVARKDADGDSGRPTGDSGCVVGDDTPWDEEWDDLLEGVDAKCGSNDAIIGRGSQRVLTVRCIRPESVECLNESICVQLLVASDLIRQQAAIEETRNKYLLEIAPFVVGTDENRKRTMDNVKKNVRNKSKLKRSRKLRKAARKRGR
ncbi:hypothetical protein LCGC14_0377990 [marine sediment metagenome]|uniref:Uncharacterized protein n=1 Tax=marine sediment metagenome TaxID=412755 RepID=A0A0F9VQE0_9ZZZZ